MTIAAGVGPHAGHEGSRRTLKVRKALIERVVGQQATHQRLAEVEDQLDGLDGLNGANDAGQYAQHAGLGTTERLAGGGSGIMQR